MMMTTKRAAMGKIAPREAEALTDHPMALTGQVKAGDVQVAHHPAVEDFSADLKADRRAEPAARPVEAHLEVAELESVVQEMTRLDCVL